MGVLCTLQMSLSPLISFRHVKVIFQPKIKRYNTCIKKTRPICRTKVVCIVTAFFILQTKSCWCHLISPRRWHLSWEQHKTLLMPALSHTHSYYFTPRHIKMSFTHTGRQTQRESDPRSSLSHRPTVPQPARVWERREARMRTALVCLREMMDEVERCDDLAHRSNSQWETTFDWHLSLSLFKRDPTSPANPVRIPRSHPHNSPFPS